MSREFADKFLAAPEFEKININRSRVPFFCPLRRGDAVFPFFLEAGFLLPVLRGSTAESQRVTSMRSSARTCRVTYRQVAAADNCIALLLFSDPLITPKPRFPHLFLLDTLYCEYACRKVFHSYIRTQPSIRTSKF